MNLEGKACGACNKGKLRRTMDEVVKGVFVEAYKCGSCGETAYSEEVMKKIEAMEKGESAERHVVKVGSSVAVPIPAALAKGFGLVPRRKVFVKKLGGEIVIKPAPA